MRALVMPFALLALAACSRNDTPASPEPPATAPTEAAGAPVNPLTEVLTYDCADGQVIEAGYPTTDTAVIKTAEHSYDLTIARSASGARYVGYGLQWWTKGMTDAQFAKLKPGEDIASDPGVACKARDVDAPVEPPAPGTPGGLPDDRPPIAEGPFTPTSAQGAADVVQTYYALIGEKKYREAWKLWSDGGRASNQTEDAFVRGFGAYRSYNAQIGAPGRIEGGAGSLYVEVPVVVYGRRANGAELHQSGTATLRRVNDVDGSTAEQRLWRISRIDLK